MKIRNNILKPILVFIACAFITSSNAQECDFKKPHDMYDLFDQFYKHLDKDCLRNISSQQLQNALGVEVVDEENPTVKNLL